MVATSTSGSALGITGNIYNKSTPEISIPTAYAIGAAISARSVYANTTLAGLGFIRSGLLETYTLDGSTQTVVVKTTPAPVKPCPTTPTPILSYNTGGFQCAKGSSAITLTGGVLSAFKDGTIKFQSGRITPNSIVPMSLSPEGASTTYTDQVGDTSDNVVSFVIEAPAGTLVDPKNLNINVGISDEGDEIIGATQIVYALNLDSETLVHSISSNVDLPFNSGTLYGQFKRALFPFPIGAPAASSGVTSFGVNIYKTPAPLSALGATAAFGFTRKLRRRIQAAA